MNELSQRFLFLQKRGIITALLLSILTCGIYSIFWIIWINNELRRESNQKVDGGFMFFISLLTCGLGGIYWVYRIGMDLSLVSKNSSQIKIESTEAVLYVILSLFGFGLIALAIMQHRENMLCDER